MKLPLASTVLGMTVLFSFSSCVRAPELTLKAPANPAPQIQYQTWQTPDAVIHLLKIPAHRRYRVIPAVDPQLRTLGDWTAQDSKSKSAEHLVAAINAGFFDPSNQKATAYVILDGKMVADPTQNPNLMGNANLKPYLPQILNRSEFRRYTCGPETRYAIARRQDATPAGCQLQDALGAGPQLLPDYAARAEGFVDETQGGRVRDPLGVDQPNARSAIGLSATHDILWVMVAQKPAASGPSGFTLPELQAFLKRQGAISAMNLDGGSSTSFYFQGKTWYGKRDESGEPIRRPIKSALLLYERP
jgi:hypothetical protein